MYIKVIIIMLILWMRKEMLRKDSDLVKSTQLVGWLDLDSKSGYVTTNLMSSLYFKEFP